MMKNWTIGRKIAAGFAVIVLLTAATGITAILAFRSVVASKDRVIDSAAKTLVEAEKLRAETTKKQAESRGFLLTADPSYVDGLNEARTEFAASMKNIEQRITTAEERRLLQPIARLEAEHFILTDEIVSLRRNGTAVEAAAQRFDQVVAPKAAQIVDALDAFIANERALLDTVDADAAAHAAEANWIITLIVALALLAAIVLSTFLTRTLTTQIGSSVGQVQSSSAELQAAANQQATGTREHSAAMSEIATTVNELLATSRQIAESAQRVAGVAEQTANAARKGEGTVNLTTDAITSIRRQIDTVVAHMLDLGRKSQQIGAVLDIVSELAEQTNILAINATIEAAGAGESGKRFGVVADEIRKLADRVGGSTKEIRALIDDVRSAVNTTVMATESGSKAVDVGTNYFAGTTSTFKEIAGLVTTTTEAAREIELSTKQQATAVEQVTVAISSITQVSKDTETSSLQTLQTASQLSQLSGELLRLIRSEAA